MNINEKKLFAGFLNNLVDEEELVISDFKTKELFSGEDIRKVYMKGDVIHICLSESISVKKEKYGVELMPRL